MDTKSTQPFPEEWPAQEYIEHPPEENGIITLTLNQYIRGDHSKIVYKSGSVLVLDQQTLAPLPLVGNDPSNLYYDKPFIVIAKDPVCMFSVVSVSRPGQSGNQ